MQRASGRTWEKWFSFLDKTGAKEWSHTEIVRHLHEAHGLSGWWSQMITNGCERSHVLCKQHEMSDGFKISKSKTIDVPLVLLRRVGEQGETAPLDR